MPTAGSRTFRAFILTSIICLLPITNIHAGSVKLTTHYPAPQGGYDRLRLVPINVSTLPCNASQEGTLAFDSSSNSLKLCNSSLTWTEVQGVWSQSGNNIFPTKTSSNPNIKVGIGTMSPEYTLTIDGDGIFAKGTFGSGGDYPSSPPFDSELVQMLWYSKKAAFRAGSLFTISTIVGDYSAIGGGKGNAVLRPYCAVSGGQDNHIPAVMSFSPLTIVNDFVSQHSVISGGQSNAVNYGRSSVIADGRNNIINGSTTEIIQNSVIGGGDGSRLLAGSGTSGGVPFTNYVIDSVIAGGSDHVITSINSVIGGGNSHYINAANSFIGGGGNRNRILNSVDSAVVGGEANWIDDSPNSFIGGGKNNKMWKNNVGASPSHNAISGGIDNKIIDSNYSVILGGQNNRISNLSQSSAILGGQNNIINSNFSTILGGSDNQTNGDYSLVGGRNMMLGANADRTFVFGYSDVPMATPVDTPDAFILYNNQVPIFIGINKLTPTNLGVGLAPIAFETGSTTGDGAFIDTDGEICVKHAPPFCVGGPPSDQRLKKNILPLTGALANLLKLQGVTFQWNELSEHPTDTNRHMGFIAQDVEAVFPNWVSSTDSNNYKTLNLEGIKAVLVESIKEIHKNVKTGSFNLDEKVASIDSGLQQIKQQNRRIRENKKKIGSQRKEIERMNSILGQVK